MDTPPEGVTDGRDGGAADTYVIVQLSDMHLEAGNPESVARERLYEDAISREAKVDMIVVTGGGQRHRSLLIDGQTNLDVSQTQEGWDPSLSIRTDVRTRALGLSETSGTPVGLQLLEVIAGYGTMGAVQMDLIAKLKAIVAASPDPKTKRMSTDAKAVFYQVKQLEKTGCVRCVRVVAKGPNKKTAKGSKPTSVATTLVCLASTVEGMSDMQILMRWRRTDTRAVPNLPHVDTACIETLKSHARLALKGESTGWVPLDSLCAMQNGKWHGVVPGPDHKIIKRRKSYVVGLMKQLDKFGAVSGESRRRETQNVVSQGVTASTGVQELYLRWTGKGISDEGTETVWTPLSKIRYASVSRLPPWVPLHPAVQSSVIRYPGIVTSDVSRLLGTRQKVTSGVADDISKRNGVLIRNKQLRNKETVHELYISEEPDQEEARRDLAESQPYIDIPHPRHQYMWDLEVPDRAVGLSMNRLHSAIFHQTAAAGAQVALHPSVSIPVPRTPAQVAADHLTAAVQGLPDMTLPPAPPSGMGEGMSEMDGEAMLPPPPPGAVVDSVPSTPARQRQTHGDVDMDMGMVPVSTLSTPSAHMHPSPAMSATPSMYAASPLSRSYPGSPSMGGTPLATPRKQSRKVLLTGYILQYLAACAPSARPLSKIVKYARAQDKMSGTKTTMDRRTLDRIIKTQVEEGTMQQVLGMYTLTDAGVEAATLLAPLPLMDSTPCLDAPGVPLSSMSQMTPMHAEGEAEGETEADFKGEGETLWRGPPGVEPLMYARIREFSLLLYRLAITPVHHSAGTSAHIPPMPPGTFTAGGLRARMTVGALIRYVGILEMPRSVYSALTPSERRGTLSQLPLSKVEYFSGNQTLTSMGKHLFEPLVTMGLIRPLADPIRAVLSGKREAPPSYLSDLSTWADTHGVSLTSPPPQNDAYELTFSFRLPRVPAAVEEWIKEAEEEQEEFREVLAQYEGVGTTYLEPRLFVTEAAASVVTSWTRSSGSGEKAEGTAMEGDGSEDLWYRCDFARASPEATDTGLKEIWATAEEHVALSVRAAVEVKHIHSVPPTAAYLAGDMMAAGVPDAVYSFTKNLYKRPNWVLGSLVPPSKRSKRKGAEREEEDDDLEPEDDVDIAEGDVDSIVKTEKGSVWDAWTRSLNTTRQSRSIHLSSLDPLGDHTSRFRTQHLDQPPEEEREGMKSYIRKTARLIGVYPQCKGFACVGTRMWQKARHRHERFGPYHPDRIEESTVELSSGDTLVVLQQKAKKKNPKGAKVTRKGSGRTQSKKREREGEGEEEQDEGKQVSRGLPPGGSLSESMLASGALLAGVGMSDRWAVAAHNQKVRRKETSRVSLRDASTRLALLKQQSRMGEREREARGGDLVLPEHLWPGDQTVMASLEYHPIMNPPDRFPDLDQELQQAGMDQTAWHRYRGCLFPDRDSEAYSSEAVKQTFQGIAETSPSTDLGVFTSLMQRRLGANALVADAREPSFSAKYPLSLIQSAGSALSPNVPAALSVLAAVYPPERYPSDPVLPGPLNQLCRLGAKPPSELCLEDGPRDSPFSVIACHKSKTPMPPAVPVSLAEETMQGTLLPLPVLPPLDLNWVDGHGGQAQKDRERRNRKRPVADTERNAKISSAWELIKKMIKLDKGLGPRVPVALVRRLGDSPGSVSLGIPPSQLPNMHRMRPSAPEPVVSTLPPKDVPSAVAPETYTGSVDLRSMLLVRQGLAAMVSSTPGIPLAEVVARSRVCVPSTVLSALRGMIGDSMVQAHRVYTLGDGSSVQGPPLDPLSLSLDSTADGSPASTLLFPRGGLLAIGDMLTGAQMHSIEVDTERERLDAEDDVADVE
ncbi:hypothetical protein KIPB_004025 [Kipferlia bialata]|uniref:B-block binding subunit of TFIIIC domain-containing protein n=1 Tax=Kipferlia bialata TaxID=797122 RepID=A0A9K3CWD3_9EUKA|nr:hypothetical protein KIPB_004025 [Kipferlia bialata]|eukprot:g4025.t1